MGTHGNRESRTAVAGVLLLLLFALLAALALAACSGSGSTASNSPSAAATTPSASLSIAPAAEPVSNWDAPGSASLAQTLAVVHRYAAQLHAKKIPGAGLYDPSATFDDSTAAGSHLQGVAAIAGLYRDAYASAFAWSPKYHVMAAPGVAIYEVQLKTGATGSTPALALLAVDGNKIRHEQVFLNEGNTGPVTFASSAPGAKDNAKVAAQVAAKAAINSSGDMATLQTLIAPDMLFRDTSESLTVPGSSWPEWRNHLPGAVTIESKKPIAGPGWAVVRWTARQVGSTVEWAMPGATVMEVRRGRIVRMTLYYDSTVMRLQR